MTDERGTSTVYVSRAYKRLVKVRAAESGQTIQAAVEAALLALYGAPVAGEGQDTEEEEAAPGGVCQKVG